MEKDKKESFLLYTEHSELFKLLSKEQAGELIMALFEYNQTGEIPDLEPVTKMAFVSIKLDLDRNAKKYEQKIEHLRENGKKGGRPKNIPPTKNETENEHEHENENENENKNENKTENLKIKNDEIESEKKQKKAIGFIKNQKVFLKSKKSLYDNVNVNVHDNVNVNEDVNVSLSSFSSKSSLPSQTNPIPFENTCSTSLKAVVSDEEREILEKHIRRQNKEVRNVRAYARKLIENGDYLRILKEEKEKKERERNKQPEGELSGLGYSSGKTKVKPPDLFVYEGVPPPPNCTLEAIKKRIEAKKQAFKLDSS